MLSSAFGFTGGMSAPHRAAALAGRDILSSGGSAVEAMVAAAATIAVAYPHMNGIGGDGFWIIHRPGHDPVAVSGCGRAAGLASVDVVWRAGHHRCAADARSAGRIDRAGHDRKLAEGAGPLPARQPLATGGPSGPGHRAWP